MRDRHATRASFACVRCKKDKRRCDISSASTRGPEGPRCTACRNRNEECEVRYGEDKRSNRQTQDTRALYRRIAALEDTIKNMPQADAAGDKTPNHQSDDNQIDLQSTTEAQPNPFLSPTTSASPSSGSQKHTSPAQIVETWPNTNNPPPPQSITSTLSFSSQRGSSVQDLTECFPSGMDEVAAPAGQASSRNNQYFGSPILFPYSEKQFGPGAGDGDRTGAGTGARDHGSDDDRVTQEEEANRRSRLALEASPEPEPIIAHLLDLFWKWQSCHLLVIDQEIFLRHRKIWDENGGSGDRNFYTPCLLYAILSMASLISPDVGVRRYSTPEEGIAGEKFAKRSRALFELEIEQPTITTVQTALILGSRYGAMVDNTLGWTYSGTAFRIASKLGLHLDCARAVASGHMTTEMAKLRRVVFWGCHIEDNLFSSYCSRPTFFMDWDITTPFPSSPPDPGAPDGISAWSSLLRTTSSLSLMCSKILVSLYGQRRRSSTAHLHSLASRVHRDLWQWYRDLPAELTLTDQDEAKVLAPEVFILQ
ncbi:hypothetical protein NW762_012641 [Fusarium torreyae]|uniref:Zn(2)-C6 fungal-type domain-containing protein n=1 Tax=Fusarium torreyae TaxID=1237075 RepID=A0A9W8V8B0_9HYPO|nr:hypothetical protein NW762_012641 [Fusarium torreyae]